MRWAAKKKRSHKTLVWNQPCDAGQESGLVFGAVTRRANTQNNQLMSAWPTNTGSWKGIMPCCLGLPRGGGTHRPSGMLYKHCPTAGTEPRAQRREVKTATKPQLNAFWGIMPSILSVVMRLGKPSASCLTSETLGWGAWALESPGSLSGFNGAAPCQLGEQGLPGAGKRAEDSRIHYPLPVCIFRSLAQCRVRPWLVRHDYKTGKERRNAASKEPTRAWFAPWDQPRLGGAWGWQRGRDMPPTQAPGSRGSSCPAARAQHGGADLNLRGGRWAPTHNVRLLTAFFDSWWCIKR